MNRSRSSFCTRGSSLVVVILTIALLSLGAGLMLRTASARYRNTMQGGSWEESIYSAEAGADIAVAALRDNTWTGWTDGNKAAVSTRPPASAINPPAGTDIRVYKTVLSHTAGQGGSQSALVVQIDAPAGLSDAAGQWYRVRSTGVAEVPGGRQQGWEPTLYSDSGARQSNNNKLRKFAFTSDRSAGLLAGRGQAPRTIEIIVKPATKSLWVRPLTLKRSIQMSGGGWIDSFDSGDPTKSTNGQYDIAKRQSHGDIGTTDSTSSDLRGTFVYGGLAYTGPAVPNSNNVQGAITTPFSETILPVSKPSWAVINPTPTSITNTTALTGGPAGAPARYKLSALTVSGGKVLTMKPHATGAESYIEVWVTGAMTTSGSGYIVQQPGVHVTYYVEGNITVSGSAFNNQSNIASNLQIYGVSPASGTKTLTVSGSGTFIGVVDAPDYDITVSGQADLSGSFIGNTVNISGGASVHYDEALGRTGSGGSSSYSVVSWAEDVR